jgi:GNAT superfamily N-acetyltransferase
VRARHATLDDVDAICRIYADACAGLTTSAEIERFYVPERVAREVDAALPSWGGWFVAETDAVIAAGGGGMTGLTTGELFVLHADRARRGEGAGSALLQAITAQQSRLGATEQWVGVDLANTDGIAFYEARGFVRRGTRPASQSAGASARYWRSLPRHPSGNPARSS